MTWRYDSYFLNMCPRHGSSEMGLVYTAQGWAVLACSDIQEDSFVAQYAGEVVNNKEADERLKAYDAEQQAIGHALLVRLWYLSANECATGLPAFATWMSSDARL